MSDEKLITEQPEEQVESVTQTTQPASVDRPEARADSVSADALKKLIESQQELLDRYRRQARNLRRKLAQQSKVEQESQSGKPEPKPVRLSEQFYNFLRRKHGG